MTILARHRPPDAKIERRIIIGMIASDDFLRQIDQIITQDSFKINYIKTISNWIIEYYKAYKKAPNRYIEDIFHKNTKINFASDQADEIEEFLAELSEEYEDESKPLNVEYLLKEAENHFRLNSLDALRVDLNKSIIGARIEDGEQLIANFKRIARPETNGIEPFNDNQAIVDALSQNQNSDKIMRFPGALGDMTGDLERGYLMAFVGNTGIGKTWWLLQVSWWAAISGYDVLFVSFEMSQKKITVRTYQWLTGLVLPKHAGKIQIPIWDCEKNQQGICDLSKRINRIKLVDDDNKLPDFENKPRGYLPCAICKENNKRYQAASWFKEVTRNPLTTEAALKKKNIMQKNNKRVGKLKVVRFPAASITMDDLKVYMQNLSDYDDFEPDVVITDYADKMKVAKNYGQKRHDIDSIWDEHKGLAQDKNILVCTASQGNTVRENKDLKQGNWAESITKLHLLDVGVIINQQPLEKKAGIYRFSVAKVRDDEFNGINQAMVLSCLKIGRPYLSSYKI